MTTPLFRKYIDIITENDASVAYQGDFEPRQLQPAELQVLQGKAVQGWVRQLGLDLSSASTGLYNLDSGAQAPAIGLAMSAPVDPSVFDEMNRALGAIGIITVKSGKTLFLVKTR